MCWDLLAHPVLHTIQVFFTSDNGAPMRPDGNLPLRGYKASIWEGGYREPVRMLCFRRNYIALNVAAFVNTSLGRAHCILKHVGGGCLNGAAGDRLDAWQGTDNAFFCAIYI